MNRKPGRVSSSTTRLTEKGKDPVLGPSPGLPLETRNILQIDPTKTGPPYDYAFEYEVKDIAPVPTGLTPQQRLTVLRGETQ
jgi:hypothetical protein